MAGPHAALDARWGRRLVRLGCTLAIGGLAALAPARAGMHDTWAAGAAARLVHPGTLTIGTNMPYPPMESYSPSHLAIGADIDLARALAGRLRLKLAVVQVEDFSTIIPRLQRHQYDLIISSMSVTPDRGKIVRFLPYMRAGASIVVAAGNLKQVQRLDDLSGLNASVEAATTEVDMLNAENKRLAALHKPLIAIKTYMDDNQALVELVRGQSDAYLTDFPVASFHVAENAGLLAIAGKQIDVAQYGIAVGKDNPGLYAALRDALGTLHRNGAYARILHSYHLDDGAVS